MDEASSDRTASQPGSGGLEEYRRKRQADRTPEPVPAADPAMPAGNDDTFVIQEHHARALHWDFRLERDGVLVSWAVPKGVPTDPRRNHLAVQTEDHPMDYAGFTGDIPLGEYGGGTVAIWDRGSYLTEKWTDREVKVVLAGQRVSGRYVLIHTDGKNWLMHRMDPPAAPDHLSMPELIRPMLATPGALPRPDEDADWAYETDWNGIRAICYVDGGRVRLLGADGRDLSAGQPQLRALGEAMGSTQAILDGELVGGPPAVYLISDLLYLDGRSSIELAYQDRRTLLDGLELAGASWQVPRSYRGAGAGAQLLRAGQQHGIAGILGKRLSGRYQPGRRSADWRRIAAAARPPAQ